MRNHRSVRPIRRAALLGAITLASLSACSSAQKQQVEQTEAQLTGAGFIASDSDVPGVAGWLKTLEPYTLVPVTTPEGTAKYAYADPRGCKCVYLGDKAAYEIYQTRQQVQRECAPAEEDEYAQKGMLADEYFDLENEEGLR